MLRHEAMDLKALAKYILIGQFMFATLKGYFKENRRQVKIVVILEESP